MLGSIIYIMAASSMETALPSAHPTHQSLHCTQNNLLESHPAIFIMRFSLITASALAAFAATGDAAVCRRWKDGPGKAYTIEASGVYGIPGWCGGLWDNLKGHAECPSPSLTSCGGENGNMEWTFQSGASCGGRVSILLLT